MNTFGKNSKKTLMRLEKVLSKVDERQINELIREILKARKVFFIGMGRSGYVLKCIAKRFCHIGICAHFVGDLNEPPIAGGDMLIVGSASGEKAVPLAVANVAREKDAKIAYLGANPASPLAKLADISVLIPASVRDVKKYGAKSGYLDGSLFEQCLLILGDTIALMIANKKKLSREFLRKRHANLE